MNKKEYYSDNEVVDIYDEKRYGGRGGQLVLAHENSAVEELLTDLDNKSIVVDMPSGTGRLASIVQERFSLIGVDYSDSMLDSIKDKGYDKVLKADAKKTGMDDSTADAIVQLRFYFHYEDIEKFVVESKRILKKGGYLIFDTLNWSPRSISSKKWEKHGGLIYIHSRKKIMKLMKELGFEFAERRDSFLLSPYITKQFPAFFVRLLIYLERFVPDRFKVLTIWKFRKK